MKISSGNIQGNWCVSLSCLWVVCLAFVFKQEYGKQLLQSTYFFLSKTCLAFRTGVYFVRFRRAKPRRTWSTRCAEEWARIKNASFQTTRVSRPPRPPRVCLRLPEKRKKIGLVLQASMYWAKNDCKACGFKRNNKYHVSQEFNVLF